MPRSDEQLTDLETVIDLACKSASAQRGIMPGVTVSPGMCCPMGAVIVTAGIVTSRLAPKLRTARQLLGITENEVYSFVGGFDGAADFWGADEDLIAMGRRFRERLIAGEYSHAAAQ